MFRHDGPPGREFNHAGTPGFPYVEIDHVHFRSTENLQHLRETCEVLQKLTKLLPELDQTILANDGNETLKNDLAWRTEHLGMRPTFWDFARADIPLQLSESLVFHGPLRSSRDGVGKMDRSSIGKPGCEFQGSSLVVAPFRCFHRQDGKLVTATQQPVISLTVHRVSSDHVIRVWS